MLRKLLFIFLCSYVVAASAQEVNVSSYQFLDTEPYLCVNPKNGNHLVAAWMEATLPRVSIVTKTSYDGGKTWGNKSILPHLFSSYTAADVSIAFNSSGNVYLSFVDFKSTFDSGAVVFTKSVNGGNTWALPKKVTDISEKPDLPIDRPWIAVDNSGGTRDGYIYITSKTAPDVPCPCGTYMKVSSDDGITWSTLKKLDSTIPLGINVNGMSVPTVSSDGTLYFMYPSYDPSLSPYARWILGKSPDGGTTFTYGPITNLTATSANNDTLLQSSYSLSVNPKDKLNLIATWTDHRNGDLDIYSTMSIDGGLSWSVPIAINDDSGNGNEQDMSWGSFSNSGTFVCAWRDRRNTGKSSGNGFETYYSSSTNKGTSFKANKKLSTNSSPLINIQRGNDFLGTAAYNNTVYGCWADLRTGNTEIFFNRDSSSTNTIRSMYEPLPEVLEVFPNPSHDFFNIVCSIKNKSKVEIELLDIEGKHISTIINDYLAAGKHSFVVKDQLKKGVYLIRFKSPEGEISKRIEKN